jgi:heme oxygenase (biliverdin-producing, ferredoxin)
MNNLKELTHEQHKNAERSLFVKKLLKQEITPYQYYVYLTNQFLMYTTLESYALQIGILNGIEDIQRGNAISKDLQELEKEYGFEMPVHLKITGDYMSHIRDISNDPEKLLAHIYVRHMGDLSGGQIIKRFVTGSGNHYVFESDINELKEKVRFKLHDGLADEAKICFNMIRDFMKELETSLGMEQSD